MTNASPLPINFQFSPEALEAIALLRREWDAQSSEPAAAVMVGWGVVMPNNGASFERLIISFYGQSELESFPPAFVQNFAGLPIVFFTTERYHEKFAGKIIDFSEDQWFFLRDPLPNETLRSASPLTANARRLIKAAHLGRLTEGLQAANDDFPAR